MGLAAPRKRVKISHDPNNTKWAQSTGGFGHKIMTSQGWTPGSYLGARNASHADTFTVASASHIRVTLKDDTLGLGARSRNMGNDNVAALDAFQGLLGRLNGKSDVQLEEEQRKRDDTRLALYARNKWQTVSFISGGYLVQEKPDDAAKSNCKNMSESLDDMDDESVEFSDGSTGHKAIQVEDSEPGLKDEVKKASKKNMDGKDGKDGNDAKDKKRRRKEKEAKKEKQPEKDKKGKKGGKKEKGEKEKKDSSRKRRRTDTEEEQNSGSLTPNRPDNEAPPPQKATALQRQTPQWRQSLRGRHIQQKKMAVMDDRSLGEIFMIKA